MRRALLLLAFASLPWLLNAQGVTTAAIQGTVTGEDGTPIAGASVRITNLSDGRRWGVSTRSRGGYLFEDVAVGGPYRIEAHALGFAPQARAGIVLALNQRLVAEFTLLTAAVELAPVAVDASADPQLTPSRTGPAEVISAARIAALPNLGRDFFTLTALSPQVTVSPSSARAPTGGIAIGGQNRLLNEFQIDGGVNHDLYTGRLPGRGTLPRPIAIEALEEIQVLVAPFDVRQGGFAGGLANAVTKSGTNIVHGSTFAYLADGALVGKDATGDPVAGFTTWQYGGTIAGPIVHDRAHYFLSVDAQHRVVPDPGPLIADTAGGADLANIGIRYDSATRFQDILRNTYGLDPGTLSSSNGRVPATDVFGKITVQLGTNSQLELSHHYSDGDRSGFIDRAYRFYWLSSTGKRDVATANASRLIWTSLLAGRWSSELIASHLRLRDACRPNVSYPQINVNADQGVLIAGTGMTCPTSFGQDAFEVQENLSAAFGVHVLTLGTHVEMLRLRMASCSGAPDYGDSATSTRSQRGARSTTSARSPVRRVPAWSYFTRASSACTCRTAGSPHAASRSPPACEWSFRFCRTAAPRMFRSKTRSAPTPDACPGGSRCGRHGWPSITMCEGLGARFYAGALACSVVVPRTRGSGARTATRGRSSCFCSASEPPHHWRSTP